MKKMRVTVFEIICYIVAAALAAVGVYLLRENLVAIQEYLDEFYAMYGMEMTMEDLGSQVYQTLITTSAPYFAYGFLALAAGRIYHVVAMPKCLCDMMAEEEFVEEIVVEDVAEEVVEEAVVEEEK